MHAEPPATSATATSGTAVLLVNLGTPEAPTPRAVRRYLAQFLHDHRVVQLTRWLWCPLLHGVILPLRAPRVAKKYAEIWMDEGSPLAVHTRRLAAAVQSRLPRIRVAHAMRYGTPSIATVLQEMANSGVERVVVLPLYPQYSTTTTASVADAIAQAAGRDGLKLRVEMIDDYHLDPDWIAAVAASIEADRRTHGRGDALLFSFHGIPQRLVDNGDPYAAQARASVAAIAHALGLRENEHALTFQSRFGREAWLQPATEQTLRALAQAGTGRVDVVCPGFAVDCLETLEEISLQNARIFRECGGQTLHYVPCLNASPSHAQALAAIVRRRLQPA